MAIAAPVAAIASDAGEVELNAIEGVLTGNLGLAVGLLITIWGLWKMVAGGETGGGILIMICGVLLTIFPGVFNTAAEVVLPLVRSVTGG